MIDLSMKSKSSRDVYKRRSRRKCRFITRFIFILIKNFYYETNFVVVIVERYDFQFFVRPKEKNHYSKTTCCGKVKIL